MELPRSRTENQLSLTRGHLHALGAMSLALALLSFFLGVQVGRRQAPPAAAPVAAALLGEEAKTGNLEQLLEKVENAQVAAQPLGFPTVLPGASAGADGVKAPVSLPPVGSGSVQELCDWVEYCNSPVNTALARDTLTVAAPNPSARMETAIGKLQQTELYRSASAPDAVLIKAELTKQRLTEARLRGYEGTSCSECHNFTMVRNGTCLKCDTCGSTSGCS